MTFELIYKIDPWILILTILHLIFFQGEGSGPPDPPPFDPCKIYIKTLQLPDASGIVKNVTFSFLYLKMFLEPWSSQVCVVYFEGGRGAQYTTNQSSSEYEVWGFECWGFNHKGI